MWYPPPVRRQKQHSEHLLLSGRYASCFHAGGLTCIIYKTGNLFTIVIRKKKSIDCFEKKNNRITCFITAADTRIRVFRAISRTIVKIFSDEAIQ